MLSGAAINNSVTLVILSRRNILQSVSVSLLISNILPGNTLLHPTLALEELGGGENLRLEDGP